MSSNSLGGLEVYPLDQYPVGANSDRDLEPSGYAMTITVGLESGRHAYRQGDEGSINITAVDERLERDLSSLVEQIDLEQIAIPTPGRTRRPAGSYERFRLIPLQGKGGDRSLGWAGSVAPADTSIEVTYRAHKTVYLDARNCIGLVKDGKLIALASAGIDNSGALKIVQIQDVTATKQGDPGYYKTGLHDGFMWRDTLVLAWEQIAIELGIPRVVIQSQANNTWGAVRDRESGKSAYDAVAQRMHYTAGSNGDWQKQLLAERVDERSRGAFWSRFVRKLMDFNSK